MVIVSSLLIFAMVLYDSVNLIYADAAPNKSMDTLNSEKQEKENQYNDSKKKRDELERRKRENAAQQLSYDEEIEQIDLEIELLTEQLFLLEELESSWIADRDAAAKRIEELEIRKENEILAFENMLRTSYQYGSDTYFNLLFGSEDIGDFLSRMDMINYHIQASDNIVTGLTATIIEEQEAKALYDESIEKIELFSSEKNEVRAQLEERSAYAIARKQELQNEASYLDEQIAEKDKEMAETEKELRKINADIEAERREQEKNGVSTPPQKYEGGTFFIPTENYRISSEFSNRISPITGRPENHNGIDLAAPGGTNIYAAADGQVIKSTYSNSWGNVIQIDHGGGLVTLYAHCSWRGVKVGEIVSKGDIIAKVGTTGWSTGNHLHFTVYEKGVAVNPRKYLPKNI